jgi:DNA-binding PadR family transcriptional regulator
MLHYVKVSNEKEARVAEPTSPTGLNATSASLLGLLAIEDWPRPWTSYELAKQAGRSLHWFWPRAQRRLLAVPKKLVELGYADAHDHPTGQRTGTRYTITDAGRSALDTWLGETGHGVTIESDELIRVFFAAQADIGQLRATLRRIADHTAGDRARLATIAADVDQNVMRGRGNVNALSIRLVSDLQATIEHWAAWALDETAEWQDPQTPWDGAEQVFREVVALGAVPARVRDRRFEAAV